MLEVAEYITKLVPGTSIEFMPPVPQDPTNRRPDLTRMNQILPGWSADIPYEDGIRRTLEWFKLQIGQQKTTPALAPAPLLMDPN